MNFDRLATLSGQQFEQHEFKASNGVTIPYRVLIPSHLQPGIRYPLVVQLHGSAAIGVDNRSQLTPFAKAWAAPELRERYQSYVILPQFPIRSVNYSPMPPDLSVEPSLVVDSAIELINDFIARNQVDRKRVYAFGFSMGGSTTWQLEAKQPTLFAAMIPIAGIAPNDALVDLYKDKPILMIHSDADTDNRIDADRRFFETIKDAGGKRIWFKEYAELNHLLPDDMYPGLWWRDWLFSQKQR
ncbi:prolyl oligopeptidase family serine peptidase [Solilutibacter silvestris]|uniref:carboxylesterase family protein n=1 Tax=Solilutibacter silvestris TaxID=1645665 RepID=UPI003D3273DD